MTLERYRPVPGMAIRPPDLVRRPSKARSQGHSKRRQLRELPSLVIVAVLLTFGLRTFLVQAFFIPSGSMVPTLELQDRILVEKFTYRFRDPRRGEVIVFHNPLERSAASVRSRSTGEAVLKALARLGLMPPSGQADLIKRVIGLPGDTVAVRAGRVVVNGAALPEPYARPETRDSAAVRVPSGAYFVMGDNRMNSLDSRFGLGFVRRDEIVGQAFAIVWPPTSARVGLDAHYRRIGKPR